VVDLSVDVSGSLNEDLSKVPDILGDNDPAYLLVRLDDPSEWLAVYYVPNSAKVRDKV
jgi:twinfilin-like protein